MGADLKLAEEIRAFALRKRQEEDDARQMAALQLCCGIELGREDKGLPETIRRLQWAIERERLRGLRKHWSYDLNRHIALKQALDRLTSRGSGQAKAAARKEAPWKKRKGKRSFAVG